ncbi:MAG: hypothetical protein WA828_16795 [Coleofasciculaceae cyanobacterium]
MLTEILPFRLQINATEIAGAALWSLALYLSLSALHTWVIEQLQRWFNVVTRSLSTSVEQLEKTQASREAQNALIASLFSIVPFLVIGGLCNWGVELSLGPSWAISMGILACMSCGIYELGRRDGGAD